jgi:subtilisin family serine protease
MKPGKKRRAPKPKRKKDRTPQRKPPINLINAESIPELSGFLIIRLKPGVVLADASNLRQLAEKFSLSGLATLLEKYDLSTTRPLVTSVSIEDLLAFEKRGQDSKLARLHSMTSYWRIDARKLQDQLKDRLEEFRNLLREEVELVYLEKSGTEPMVSANDEFAGEQGYLDASPAGIDARAAWNKGVDGAGLHFIDLERAWILTHQDLPTPTLLKNCNFDFDSFRNHGTSVLGVVAGVDDARGIVGIAPNLASVRVVSRFRANTCENGHTDAQCRPGAGGVHTHVADAICAATWATPRPHVLLIEHQQFGNLPTETDSSVFDAIREAVRQGITVIEPAGNGSINLDLMLNIDSGAILVGAAKKDPVKVNGESVHERWKENSQEGSNFGSRINCYAWGEGIVSAGWGDKTPRGAGVQTTDNRYTGTFGGTSGASAIIAGAALLVLGLHLARNRPLPSPADLRNILSNQATGTRAPGAEPIGVMPDLQRIIQTLGL